MRARQEFSPVLLSSSALLWLSLVQGREIVCNGRAKSPDLESGNSDLQNCAGTVVPQKHENRNRPSKGKIPVNGLLSQASEQLRVGRPRRGSDMHERSESPGNRRRRPMEALRVQLRARHGIADSPTIACRTLAPEEFQPRDCSDVSAIHDENFCSKGEHVPDPCACL